MTLLVIAIILGVIIAFMYLSEKNFGKSYSQIQHEAAEVAVKSDDDLLKEAEDMKPRIECRFDIVIKLLIFLTGIRTPSRPDNHKVITVSLESVKIDPARSAGNVYALHSVLPFAAITARAFSIA